MRLRSLAAIALAGLVGLAGRAANPPPLILISLDGFRWDYCARHPEATPHLRRLAAEGVAARSLIPVFPSNTFPNHYSIVTGLYPSHHGIINNDLFDQRLGAFFHYKSPLSVRDPRWWGGEPIWATAVRQGRKSATSYWVGAEAETAGVRPTFWRPYDYAGHPFAARIEEIIRWLRLPEEQRPAVLALYYEETNSIGHRTGPESGETTEAIRLLDTQVGAITARLAEEKIAANLVIVSDHGMTACDPERVLMLDDLVDLATVQVDFDQTVVGLRPLRGREPTNDDGAVSELMRSLEKLPPQVKAYRAADLPARLHIDAVHPRVPPVWLVPNEGWEVMRRSVFNFLRARFEKGQHGYDPGLPSMHGIFIAHGPSFRPGVVLEPFENVHIYNLLCAVAGLTPAPNDGDNRLLQSALR